MSESRQNAALYAGLERQPTTRTNLDVVGRVEQSRDVGTTVNGKVAGRLAVVKRDDSELAVRGAASTGCARHGLQQIWYSTIVTNFVTDPTTTETTPVEILISPNRSPVTEAFGVPAASPCVCSATSR